MLPELCGQPHTRHAGLKVFVWLCAPTTIALPTYPNQISRRGRLKFQENIIIIISYKYNTYRR